MANMLATNIIYQNKLHWSISENKFIFLFSIDTSISPNSNRIFRAYKISMDHCFMEHFSCVILLSWNMHAAIESNKILLNCLIFNYTCNITLYFKLLIFTEIPNV